MNGTYKITHSGFEKKANKKSEPKEIVWIVQLREDIPHVGKISGDFCGKYTIAGYAVTVDPTVIPRSDAPIIRTNSAMLIAEGQCTQQDQNYPGEKHYTFSLMCPTNGDVWEGQGMPPGESEKMLIRMEKIEKI
jgi:hypothetical protein